MRACAEVEGEPLGRAASYSRDLFRAIMRTRKRCAALVLAALTMAGFAASPPAPAQEPYPSKPISLIVPFPPGGVADIVGRPVADAMGRSLNVPVVVENKAGAGGGSRDFGGRSGGGLRR